MRQLARAVDAFMFDLDPYSYRDNADEDGSCLDHTLTTLSENPETIIAYLEETIEDIDDAELTNEARCLIERIRRL